MCRSLALTAQLRSLVRCYGMGARAAAATGAFRAAFDHSRASTVNWYPGHMATATRKLEDAMRHVDLVLEVRGERGGNTSHVSNSFALNLKHLSFAGARC